MTSPYTAVNEVRTTRWHDRPNDGDTAVEIFSEQFPKPIARVLSYSSRAHGPGRHERDRYARLIAAAPDMLGALKSALPVLEATQRLMMVEAAKLGMEPDNTLLNRLRAAIASAESSS